MAVPFAQPITSSTSLSDEQILLAVTRAELDLLSAELPDLEKYRSWYDGDQKLTFGTEVFKQRFGNSFEGYADNWCAVVVDAVLDKLEVDGISFPSSKTSEEGEAGVAERGELDPLARRLWDCLAENDFDEQQQEIHEGALVEGRSAVIVWPDEELGARVDFQPAQTIRVRYDDDDYRRPVLAVKRWITPSGEIRVSVYTNRYVYKFRETANAFQTRDPSAQRAQALIAPTNPNHGLERREVPGEPWPLPHFFGEVPVVEFWNKRGSEIENVIPQQDAINFLLYAGFGMVEESALPPRGFFTGAKEPSGGWKMGPGQFWTIPPMLDPDGKPIPAEVFEFSPGDLDQIRNFTDSLLMHTAFTSKTPLRYFFQSDRGGRGDAPSGESFLVSDQQLLDKVDRRMTKFGISHHRVLRLVGKAITGDSSFQMPRGSVIWQDPRAQYRSAILEDAMKMQQVGLPFRYIIQTLGLTPAEVEMVLKFREEEKAEMMEEEKTRMEMQAAANPNPVPSSSSSSSSNRGGGGE